MAADATQQQFINSYASYAQIASQQTGVPWQVILAQWADETGWGTSSAFLQGYNFAGISPGGRVAAYPSISAGLTAYIQTLLSPTYAAVRNASSQGPVAAAQALGASPWAASQYNYSGGGPGSDLVNIMNETGLDPSASATAAQQATETAYIPGTNIHIPGTGSGSSIVPSYVSGPVSDIANAVVSALLSAVEKPAIGALFLILAGGLVAAGVWHAAQPTVKPALEDAKNKGQQAAGLAAMAAA